VCGIVMGDGPVCSVLASTCIVQKSIPFVPQQPNFRDEACLVRHLNQTVILLQTLKSRLTRLIGIGYLPILRVSSIKLTCLEETFVKIMNIVGARPEFIQTAPVTRAIRQRHTEILVHTGQHYDDNMSAVFFSDLGIPPPELNLGVGGGSHAEMTGQMLIKLEQAMLEHQPDWVLVFGDTNSTVAAALAAAKIHIPVAHIEAGLRSYDRQMPEEINRVMTDHLSTLLFPPTQVAVDNLRKEGLTRGVHLVGDVRVDVVLATVPRAQPRQAALFEQTQLKPGQPFALATIHRASNTDDATRLTDIVNASIRWICRLSCRCIPAYAR
jgi:UDP-N-acetylglucosamine 2-epimerase